MLEFLTKSLIFMELELRKVRHDPIDIFVRSIQPALWIIVFGSIFSRIRDLPTDGIPYIQFMTPGILAQSVMFMAIFTGISIVWERDLGQMSKLLAAPVPRSSIAIGKALAAGVRGLMQALTIFALAIVLQIPIIFNPLYIIAVILVVFALGAAFASVSTFIALVLKTRDRVMGVSQIMTMPLFFASNALYPISSSLVRLITYLKLFDSRVASVQNIIFQRVRWGRWDLNPRPLPRVRLGFDTEPLQVPPLQKIHHPIVSEPVC